jgi:hypothetical protein
MKYNAEQVAFMLHEAIDENREYKSWHCSTQHLMALVERVVAEEREACAKETKEIKDLLTLIAGIVRDTHLHGSEMQRLLDKEKAIRARGGDANTM